jgi:hypothetical protein
LRTGRFEGYGTETKRKRIGSEKQPAGRTVEQGGRRPREKFEENQFYILQIKNIIARYEKNAFNCFV